MSEITTTETGKVEGESGPMPDISNPNRVPQHSTDSENYFHQTPGKPSPPACPYRRDGD